MPHNSTTHNPTIYEPPADYIPSAPDEHHTRSEFWQRGYRLGWTGAPTIGYHHPEHIRAFNAGYCQGASDRRMAGTDQ